MGMDSPVNIDSLTIHSPFNIIASHGIIELSSTSNISPGNKSHVDIYTLFYNGLESVPLNTVIFD